MSRKNFSQACQAVLNIDGVYLHSLTEFTNGKISINKQGRITTPIAFNIEELGSSMPDIRAAHAPHCFDNKLVPMLCFIAPDEFMAGKRLGQDEGIANALQMEKA